MSRDTTCGTPDQDLQEVVAIMRERRLSCLVITEGSAPVGIITERDLVHTLGRFMTAGAPPTATARYWAGRQLTPPEQSLDLGGLQPVVVVGRIVGVFVYLDLDTGGRGRLDCRGHRRSLISMPRSRNLR